MNLFANYFDSTINKRILTAIKPFLILHICIDDMEHRLSGRLREISIPNLTVFKAALDKAKADVVELQSHKIVISSDPVAKESEKKPLLIEITRKYKDKNKEKED